MTILDFFKTCNVGPWKEIGIKTNYRIEKTSEYSARVYFQCSASVVDWVVNILFKPIIYKQSPVPWRVSLGFATVWHKCRDKIMTELDGYSIVEIVGYSHGAVLASLLHEDLVYSRGIRPHTITFGGPRFCWFLPEEVKTRFSDIKRYFVKGDLVTHLPPFCFGFDHIGTTCQVGPESNKISWKHHRPEEYELALSEV